MTEDQGAPYKEPSCPTVVALLDYYWCPTRPNDDLLEDLIDAGLMADLAPHGLCITTAGYAALDHYI